MARGPAPRLGHPRALTAPVQNGCFVVAVASAAVVAAAVALGAVATAVVVAALTAPVVVFGAAHVDCLVGLLFRFRLLRGFGRISPEGQ